MARSTLSLQELVSRLYEANKVYADLTGEPIHQKLGKPATPAEIAEVEARIGATLPKDFRDFLLLHNGWKYFEEEASILSTSDLAAGPVADWISALKREWGGANKSLEDGLVFVAANGHPTVTYFDLTKRRRDGGWDVVEWDEGEEVIRHRSFLVYLKETLSVVEELIEEER